MNSSPVSLHPYFKAHPGQLPAIQALLPAFRERTSSEPAMLCYEFTAHEDEIFCREAYRDAEGALAHLSNVEELLGQMLKLADLTRLEIHGPAGEVDKMKGPLAHLPVVWFALVA
jgi:quinol monooxygenase YgiN